MSEHDVGNPMFDFFFLEEVIDNIPMKREEKLSLWKAINKITQRIKKEYNKNVEKVIREFIEFWIKSD